jgi:hypothetical protein
MESKVGPIIDPQILGTRRDRVALGERPLRPDAFRKFQK